MGRVVFNTDIDKTVNIDKRVTYDVIKNVATNVDLDGSLASAEASADAVGFDYNIAETETFAQVTPEGAFSFSDALAAGNFIFGDIPPVLDIVLLQDLSGSFGDDLLNLQGGFIAGLLSDLEAEGVESAGFGVSSFIDYPFEPFGASDDFIYNTDQGVTTVVATAQGALDGLSTGDGFDVPEAQLVGLQQVALRAGGEIGYRPDAVRFVVLSTDAPFHVEGDFPAGGDNDNDIDLADGAGPGGVEDYPSIDDIAAALGAANVTPIFTVTADVFDIYEQLLADLNAIDPSIGGDVVELSSDSSDLAAAIIEGLTNVSADLFMMA